VARKRADPVDRVARAAVSPVDAVREAREVLAAPEPAKAKAAVLAVPAVSK